jgi:hypothetical protein
MSEPIDLDKIESNARRVQQEGTWRSVVNAIYSRLDLCVEEFDHIKNCSPDVVLALVQRVRELEGQIESEAFERATAVEP